jgi:hypothetical protein
VPAPVRHFLLALTLLFLPVVSQAQGVWERGTFVTLPAGKHVNHIHQGAWNTYFAVEDGVLVYNHHEGKWLDPITASNGMLQYPALLVWQDPVSREVWIVSPDYIFIFDHGTGWIQHELLPMDKNFVGRYRLGISTDRIVVSAAGNENVDGHSAVYLRNSGQFEKWGPDDSIDIDWNTISYLESEVPSSAGRTSYLTDLVRGGVVSPSGMIRLDGYPQKSGAEVSALIRQDHGESFMGTQGLGVFYREATGSEWVQLPFGLLSPDVMSLKTFGEDLIIGSRTGLTFLDDLTPIYDEAITHAAYDYSFVSAVETTPKHIFSAGRGGVFKRALKGGEWNRLMTKDDLKSKQIYALAAGLDGNLMIATEENAYLYHESGLLMESLFPKSSRWTVYDVTYSQGNYYLGTVFGLYVYSEAYQAFTARINSQGQVQNPKAEPALDPVYQIHVQDSLVWASTSRGLIRADMISRQGTSFLSPESPFKPRGLVVHGGSVWVGTESGLYAFKIKTMAWKQYSRNDGLISNFITDLAARGDYIWVGSNLGLTRITWQNLH